MGAWQPGMSGGSPQPVNSSDVASGSVAQTPVSSPDMPDADDVASDHSATGAARDWLTRESILLGLALLLSLVLLGGLGMHILGEEPETNSYALLAEAFLNGSFSGDRCFDGDCARYDGRVYVIFPPVPAVIAMPFVAAFSVDFAGFAALGALASAIALLLWWRIFALLGIGGRLSAWLLLALAFGSPLYYVTIRSDQIWFYAQAIAFVFVTFAIYEVVRGGRLWVAGLSIAAAFLSRQMSLLYLPFLFVLALQPGEPLISLRKHHIARALKLGLPVLGAVGIYLLYNQLRFGDPLDTGYAYIAKTDGTGGWISRRIAEFGLFSLEYLFFNFVHFFVEGFHFAFGGRYVLEPLGVNPMGASIFAASPFVLLAFFAPVNRITMIGLVTAAAMIVPVLFYHSNGYSQHNVQRYVLDWLPIVLYALAFAVGSRLRPAFAILAVYAIALNVATMALLAQFGSLSRM